MPNLSYESEILWNNWKKYVSFVSRCVWKYNEIVRIFIRNAKSMVYFYQKVMQVQFYARLIIENSMFVLYKVFMFTNWQKPCSVIQITRKHRALPRCSRLRYLARVWAHFPEFFWDLKNWYFDFLCKSVRIKNTQFFKITQLQRSLQKKLEGILKNEDHFKGGPD